MQEVFYPMFYSFYKFGPNLCREQKDFFSLNKRHLLFFLLNFILSDIRHENKRRLFGQ